MLGTISINGQMSWLDWGIVLIPLFFIVYIGCRVQRYVNSVSGFLAAGRKAGRYLLAVADGTAGMGLISVSATFEILYQTGFALSFWNSLMIAFTLVMTLTGFVSYRYRETRVLTMAELLEKRYSHGFRIYAGTLAFISGLINYSLFPAVGARFFIYYCNLPFTFSIGRLEFSTYGVLMAIFLGIALAIVLTGGQLTTMVTDCCQGIFGYLATTAIVITVLCLFSLVDVQEVIMARPAGTSFVNPFNVGKFTSFNLLYIFIGMFSAIYSRNCWLGNQAYMSSAINPHEQKMAGVLGTWRNGFQYVALTLLVVAAYTFMNAKKYTVQHTVVDQILDEKLSTEFPYTQDMTDYIAALPEGKIAASDVSPTAAKINDINRQRSAIRSQVLVPVVLRNILPIGIMGTFCAMMVFLMVSTDTTYMHSWGTILAQDIILPTYNKPVKTKTQLFLLRAAITAVAVFAWFFSYFFSQGDYILQFFALTGTIFLGGAGSCVIGALYWKKGTTAGAYTAMTLGLLFAILGFCLDQKWATCLYPLLQQSCPDMLEGFRSMLEHLGDVLFFVNWETSPEAFMQKFPITGQEFYFLSMLTAVTGYIVVSLLTCKKSFNLDKMLNRGQYNKEHFVANDAEAQAEAKQESEEKTGHAKHRFDWKQTLLGFTPEYTKGDRILAWSVLIWSAWRFLVFLIEAVWNSIPGCRWSELTWFKIWEYYTVPLDLIIALISTVWFTIGSTDNLIKLIKTIKEDYKKSQAEGQSDAIAEDNGLQQTPEPEEDNS